MIPSQKEQDDAVRRISRVFNNEWQVFSSEFDEYEKGYDYLMGNQYSDNQKAWHKVQRRPTNVWNLIFPVFNRILGDFLQSFQRERVFNKAGGSVQMAATIEKMIETIALNNEYKDEMAMTLLAGLVKRGYIYSRFSNEEQIDGSIVISNIDEFEIMFDSRSVHPLLDDAQYQIRSKWLTTEQILVNYSQHRSKLEALLADREESAYWEAADEFDRACLQHKNFSDQVNGRYRVVEFHDRVWKNREIAYDSQTGESNILTLEGKRKELFLRANPQIQIVEDDNAEVIQVTESIPGLMYFLDQKDADIQDKHFDYIPFSPYSYGKKSINSFGIFQNAIGPQDNFNDMKNQVHNIVNKAANAVTLTKPMGIRNHQAIKDHLNEPGLNVQVKDGYKFDDVFRREKTVDYPGAEDRLADSSYSILNKIIGLTENMRGETQTNSENASLFYQRVKEAQKSFIPVDRAIKRVTSRMWNRTIKLMQSNYTQEKIFLSVDMKNRSTQEIVLNMNVGDDILNDMNVGEYYVFPTQEEMNPTMRAYKFLQKTELVKQTFDMLGPTGIDFEWWWKNADFEDIQDAINKAVAAQQAMMQQQSTQSQMQEAAGVMDLAGQQFSLEGQAKGNLPDSPATGKPGNNQEGE